MKSLISVVVVAAAVSASGHSAQATTATKAQAVDSGRYGVEAACEPVVASTMNCDVSVRDLVYDTVLVKTRLGLTLHGALGSGLAFNGNPAKGPKQGIAVNVGRSPDSDRVAFSVAVSEGEHIVQKYSFLVPVSGK
jgi:hypothetical protein